MTRKADQLRLKLADKSHILACEDMATFISIASLDAYLPVDKCCLACAELSYHEALKLASWLIDRVQRAEEHRLRSERAA